ncbi:(2Fe-2S)-binding protein [Halocalculus aciditolerans]|uniref:2Fe-2S ferredoxin-type domain-containing protein n=1 Tax=Halocalculus aciditolerans TaxID=1383812 RepID=A0A830F942_9EURY|nr:(2Fe-2S)-binding protein [Halocalculus aciditolerans]GGL51852.1 hypothetical protein GCM10009039_07610 [Halocalculus aciditolerans]
MTFEDDTTVEPCGPDCACATSDDATDAEAADDDTRSSNRRGAVGAAAAGAGALSALAGCNSDSGGDTTNATSISGSGTTSADTGGSEETESISFTLNGEERTFNVSPDTPLLYVLRNEAGMNGPKFGCGLSQCGACTTLLGDNAIRSCVTPVSSVNGKEVTTTSGLGSTEDPSALQQAFIDQQAAQCGYCISGMIMEAESFLRENTDPSRQEIKQALNGHLCRCGTHNRIVDAVEQAAGER